MDDINWKRANVAMSVSINTARACLIVLMILVHITQWGDHYPQAKLGILSFMMPAFLFVTGMLLNVQKGLGDFLRYLRGILVPYVVLVSAPNSRCQGAC